MMDKLYYNRFKSIILITYSLVIVFGCVSRQKVQIEQLDVNIPKTWTVPIPPSEKISGDWWSVFNDPVLDTFLVRLRTESPDMKTLVQNQKIGPLQCKNQWCLDIPIA